MIVVLNRNKKDNKSKGFTLVELLAVVAIIALLVAIAIFSINRLFGNSEDKADEINLESIKNSAVIYANENYLSNVYWVSNGNSEYSCVPILELVNKGYLKENKVSEYKDSWQFIKVNRDVINKTIISEEGGAGTCYYGADNNGEIFFSNITKTTTSIKLQAQCSDISKEVRGISFAFKDKEYTDQMTILNSESKYIYEFSSLDSDKSYSIKARCNYIDGTYSKDTYINVQTGIMTYKFSLPDGSKTKFNDNTKKIYKTIKIDFNSENVSNPSYYFKSTANDTFSDKEVLECGNGDMPNSCIFYNETESGYNGIKLRNGYWYKIDNVDEESSVNLDVYDNATILALGYDGGVYLDVKSTQITFTSNPYVILNITHSNSGYSYGPEGFLGSDNYVEFYIDKWMSMPKISWQVYGGYETKSYVYYSDTNYSDREEYKTSNVVSGYDGKTTCNVSGECFIDDTNFTKGGMQEIAIVVVNVDNGKETIIKVKVNIDNIAPVVTVSIKNEVGTTINSASDYQGSGIVNYNSGNWAKSFPTIYFDIEDISGTQLSVFYNSDYTYSNRTDYSTSNIMNRTWDSDGNATSSWNKVSDTSGSFTIRSGGKRQIALYVKDTADNETTVVINADLDNIAPSAPTTPTFSSGKLAFNGGSDSESGFAGYGYTLYNNSDWSDPVSTAGTVTSLDISDLSTGTYTIYVNAKDRVGNVSDTLDWDINISNKTVPNYSCPSGYSDYGNSTYCRKWVSNGCSKSAYTSSTCSSRCYYSSSGSCATGAVCNYCHYSNSLGMRFCFTTKATCESVSDSDHTCQSYSTSYYCDSGSNLSGSTCYYSCYYYDEYYVSSYSCADGYIEYNGICYKVS